MPETPDQRFLPFAPVAPDPVPVPVHQRVPSETAKRAMVLGFFSFVPIVMIMAVAYGIRALGETRGGRMSGRGRAVTGLVLAAVWALVFAGYFVYQTANESGTTTGPVAIDKLRVGDCVAMLPGGGMVSHLTRTPCTQTHNAEVFAIFDLTSGSFPGDEGLARASSTSCQVRLDQYSSSAASDEALSIVYFAPNVTSWQTGDRKVICIAISDAGKQLTSSLKG